MGTKGNVRIYIRVSTEEQTKVKGGDAGAKSI